MAPVIGTHIYLGVLRLTNERSAGLSWLSRRKEVISILRKRLLWCRFDSWVFLVLNLFTDYFVFSAAVVSIPLGLFAFIMLLSNII